MAVSNTLTKADPSAQTLSVKYKAGGDEVWLTPTIVKKYLVSGDASRVTDAEVALFIKLCQFQHLNPFLREAYLVKFGTEAATIVTGKETFTKRANR